MSGYDDFDETAPISRLEDPLELSDVLKGKIEFTVRSEEQTFDETDVTKVYSYDQLKEVSLPEVNEVLDDDEIVPFPVYYRRTHNLFPDGKIRKEVLMEGTGEEPTNIVNLVVYIHYSAYVEFNEHPFDSTRLNHDNFVKYAINGTQVPGFETAIRSMKKGEKSRFIVHPDLAYKKLGVPPRIPPEAYILYDIEMSDFFEDVVQAEEEDNTKIITFEDKYRKACLQREKGCKLMKNDKKVKAAISSYKKGVTELFHNYANEVEENKAKELLFKLYVNLAVCFLRLKEYKQVCNMYNDACHDCPKQLGTSAKMYYLHGKAMRFLREHKKALQSLLKAARLEPGNKEILIEMDELQMTEKRDREEEHERCRRMFSGCSISKSEIGDEEMETLLATVDDEFKSATISILDKLRSDEDRSVESLKLESTEAELEFIKKECYRRHFEYRCNPSNDGTVDISIIKKFLPRN